MDVKPDLTQPDELDERAPTGGWQRVVKQLLGIFGAIAAFLGLFILYAGDDHTIGFWDSSWEVGEIDAIWGYGLLIGGGLVLVVLAAWVARGWNNN